MISYRMAEFKDMQFLFDLKNDPGVRESSIMTRDGIGWADHCEWIVRTLKDPYVALWIIMEDDQPVGTWRMNRIHPNCVEVAIHLVESKRHNGIGSKVLGDFCRPFLTTWVATIVDANESSIRLFTSAGFKPEAIGHTLNNIPYHVYRKVA